MAHDYADLRVSGRYIFRSTISIFPRQRYVDGSRKLTVRSCHEWRTRRSIVASNTSSVQRIRQRQRRQICHLENQRLVRKLCLKPSPQPETYRINPAREIGYLVGDAMRRHTDCCRFDHVADGESFDCLILGRTSRAVRASDRLNVTSPLLVTTAMNQFLSTLVLISKTGIMNRGFPTLMLVS